MWSPIRSVILRVINKIRRLLSGSPICLITSMIITDQIGRREVLLPILIITLTKFVIYKALFKIKTQEIPRFVFASNEKKQPFKRAHDGMYCPIIYLPTFSEI